MAIPGLPGIEGIGQFGTTLVSLLKGLMFAITIIAFIIAVAVIGWHFFRPMTYNIDINIFARRQGQSIMIGRDKAKISKRRTGFLGIFGEPEEPKLHWLGRKIYMPIPDPEYLYQNDGRRSQGTLNYYRYGAGDTDYAVSHTIVDKTGIILKPIDTDMRTFAMNRIREAQRRNPTLRTLEKYQVVIASGFICIIIIVSLWFFKGIYHDMFSMFASAAKDLAESIDAINKCRM